MKFVEVVMCWYVEKFDGDVDEWGFVGLLYDFDWEIYLMFE